MAGDSPYRSLEELAAAKGSGQAPGQLRVSRTDPQGAGRPWDRGRDLPLSYGATEAKVPDIADAVVDMTETGSALRAGLRVIAVLWCRIPS